MSGYCRVCDNKYYKNLDKHQDTNKHIYNIFQYDLNKHIDNMIIAGDIREEDRKNVICTYRSYKEGEDRIYQSNNKKDVIDMLRNN
jgi:hypothetical protein